MWILKLFCAYCLLHCAQSCSCLVFLTISTNALTYYDSKLVINWGPDCEHPPTTIKVFDYNPYAADSEPLFTTVPGNELSGRVVTNVTLKELSLPYQWDTNANLDETITEIDQQKCLDYFVVSYNRTNHVASFECLKIHPQWMTEMESIWSLPLKQLYIPGTHCSGCYMTRDNVKDKSLRKTGFLQNFDVWHQLMFGVRQLDFSIELFDKIDQLFYNPDGPFYEKLFWVKNGDQKISPLLPILKDVMKFVDRTHEIVILSFSSFSSEFSSSPEVHEVFKQLLSYEIGAYAVINHQNGSKSFDLTIQEMKDLSKFLLITYDHHNLSTSYGELSNDCTLKRLLMFIFVHQIIQ